MAEARQIGYRCARLDAIESVITKPLSCTGVRLPPDSTQRFSAFQVIEGLKGLMSPSSAYSPPGQKGIISENVKKFEQTTKQLGIRVEIKSYLTRGHPFENPVNKDRYRADDAADAWKRSLAFLDSTLKK